MYPLFKKILQLLRVQSAIGGLEISDGALRFARFDGESWRTQAVRLPPGVIAGDKVQDYPKFVESLRALHGLILGVPGSRRRVNVVVSLSSIRIYSQVFSLPMIEGENLEKAVQLNIRMVSPIETSQAYAGWQLVGRDAQSLRVEVLSAFIHRATVDELRRAFTEAGFVVYSFEPRALSLVRLLRERGSGFDPRRSYVLVTIDSSGLEFLVVRSAQLYFQYFVDWGDLQGEERKMTRAAFEAAIVKNMHQVLNFYHSHWSEPLGEVLVSTSAMKEEIARLIQANFSLTAREFAPNVPAGTGPEWFVGFGSGLRALVPRYEDVELNLLGRTAREEFWREQVIVFFRFWRVLIPAALTLLLFAFLGAEIFLIEMKGSLATHPLRTLSDVQSKEVETLRASTREFNQTVSAIERVDRARTSRIALVDRVNELASRENVLLTRFSVNIGGQSTLLGQTRSDDDILRFKKVLETELGVQSVSLPLSEIRRLTGGVTFVMHLSIASSTAR